MNIQEIEPEIKECAKRVVNLMFRSCVGENEFDMAQNMGIVVGMLMAHIGAEHDRRLGEKG